MCPECGWEEEVPFPIRIITEKRDRFLFACVFKWERGGWYGGVDNTFPRKRRRHTVDYYGDTEVGEPCMFLKGMYLSRYIKNWNMSDHNQK